MSNMIKKQFAKCPTCDTIFQKRRNTSIYCSRRCSALSCQVLNLKPKLKNGIRITCECCGKSFYVPKYRAESAKYCSKQCLAKIHLAQFSDYRFKPTGKAPKKYKQICVNGKNVREHRFIMEQHLGRKLTRDEHVHHINGDSLDNRITNLIVLSNSDHQKIEVSLRCGELSQD